MAPAMGGDSFRGYRRSRALKTRLNVACTKQTDVLFMFKLAFSRNCEQCYRAICLHVP